MNFSTWWAWAISYEPTLSEIDISTSIPAILTDTYTEAEDSVKALEHYMSPNNYTLLVYRLALHILILNSRYSNIVQLKSIFDNYEISGYAGVIQSASSGPTSTTKLIPKGLQEGDASTILLWSTPYGQYVESVFEQLKDIAITI